MKYEFGKLLLGNREHLSQILQYRLGNRNLSPVRFVIFGRGRSGSTALVSLLNSIEHLRCDGEILNQPLLFPFSHVLAKCGNAASPIYGCKILSYQIKNVQPISNRQCFIRRLHDNGFKILYLKRENLICHALSNIRAREFGFHKKKSDQPNDNRITVDLDELFTWIKSSERLDEYEKVLLEDVPHLPLTYEKNLIETENHQRTVETVCDYLGIESSEAKSEYRKVSPKIIRDSVANYDQLVSFFDNTPYEKYLDEFI